MGTGGSQVNAGPSRFDLHPLGGQPKGWAGGALKHHRIDAFVTTGGGVEVKYLINNPELGVIAKLRAAQRRRAGQHSGKLPQPYGQDGLRVAVIDGFWHEEYLQKNVRHPRIVKTQDIMESLRKVRDGEADYLIENPTMIEFYINGQGYQDLVKRGNTSSDSFPFHCCLSKR